MQSISILNLIDVIFVLLIFFMLTTTFKKNQSFDVNLPKSKASFKKDKKQDVTIFYQKNGEVVIVIGSKKPIATSFDELSKTLRSLNLNSYETIHVSADKDLSYGRIVMLMTALKSNGVSNISLDIQVDK
ncbi:biopolymer transporter ExbD [Helicobacter sp. 13S00401-1]|uniref:ExbD/TolR family protein n=1 Tax=Helicobacter sp. 13S00401-1 TaxID=1905758 RepID=UPI001552EA0E|nr:biopolymer transporter ExbD [Helicobacter sp. 13S00401-1]